MMLVNNARSTTQLNTIVPFVQRSQFASARWLYRQDKAGIWNAVSESEQQVNDPTATANITARLTSQRN